MNGVNMFCFRKRGTSCYVTSHLSGSLTLGQWCVLWILIQTSIFYTKIRALGNLDFKFIFSANSVLNLFCMIIFLFFSYFARQENLSLDKFLEDIVPERRPQPFILLTGSLLKPVQVFMIVERQAFEQSSLMKAVDTCFKAVYVLDLEYQPQCCGAWEFLQTYIYEMEGAVKCSAIREFRIFETASELLMNTNI